MECGGVFEIPNARAALCEPCKIARRKRFRPQTFKACASCGRNFGPVDKLARIYCSLDCKGAASRDKPTGKRGKVYPSLQRAKRRDCECCGSEFRAVKDTQRRKQLYCSHTCYLRNRRVSRFETRVLELIASFGVEVEPQAKRGRWTFDGALSGTRLLVEADGDFWHRSDAVRARDARKDEWCEANGYVLLRVPELQFYRDPLGTIDVILRRWEAETGKTATRVEAEALMVAGSPHGA